MKRSRELLALGVIGFAAACGLAAVSPRVAFEPYDFLAFAAAMLLVTFLDMWLPLDGEAGMGTALAIAAILRFDALVVILMLGLSEVLAVLPGGSGRRIDRAFGTITARSIATALCSLVLAALRLHPSNSTLLLPGAPLAPWAYLALLAVALLFALIEAALMRMGESYDRGSLVSFGAEGAELTGWLVAAQASAGLLSALMFRTMGAWGLGLTLVIILVMRQSFLLLLEIRQTYESTIDVLAKAMEAQSPGRVGRSKLVSEVCGEIGRRLGYRGRDLETLRYSALLFDVCRPSPSADDESGSCDNRSSRIVEGVAFLDEAVPLLRLCDGEASEQVSDEQLSLAYLVLLSSDALTPLPRKALLSVRGRLSAETAEEIEAVAYRHAGRFGEPFREAEGSRTP